MGINTIKGWLIALSVIIGAVLLSYHKGRRDGEDLVIKDGARVADTLYVRDTIVEYEPILEERVVLKKVLVPVTDTLWIRDTLYVYLEREQVVWQDSLSRVYASGISPQIDSVQHFIQEKVVTITIPVKKPCRWGIGVQAGYGIPVGGRPSPYLGVGVTYNLLTW